VAAAAKAVQLVSRLFDCEAASTNAGYTCTGYLVRVPSCKLNQGNAVHVADINQVVNVLYSSSQQQRLQYCC
jgi:hypothetical protein